MKANLQQINAFLKHHQLALVGVSRDPKKFGSQMMKHLLERDFDVIPLHPEVTELQGKTCVANIADLPDTVKALCLALPKDKTDAALKQALDKGIEQIWIQQFSDGPETPNLIKASKANVVTGRCIFMYTDPEGFHKFHKRLNKMFGGYAS
ncbi:MAG: CoA-binding protein [Bacteroidetes bacterium]|nr:CoA-binding protein [Bacteroidota bacterium]